MGFDALSDRSKSVERARRRNSHGTEFPQEARMGSHKAKQVEHAGESHSRRQGPICQSSHQQKTANTGTCPTSKHRKTKACGHQTLKHTFRIQ